MKYYYQFKAIISGAKAVGKKTILKSLDSSTDLKTVQLHDKMQETLFIYEFQKDESYIPDALCFLIVCDQSSQSIQYAKSKIQIILKQLNRSYQFIVLINNKVDSQLSLQDELENYCAQNQINFIATSAKFGTNVILLQNLLRIKAQLIMKKCQIQPFPLESNREKEFETIDHQIKQVTQNRPLPQTPQSSGDKENQSDYKSIKSETVESFRAFELIQDKSTQHNDTINILTQSTSYQNCQIQNSQVLPSTKRAYLDLNTNCRLRSSSPISKILMCLQIELNDQIFKVDVYFDDSYPLIVERICSAMQKKVKQTAKKQLMSTIETHVTSFIQKLNQQFQEKRYLRVKDCYEKFISIHNQQIQQRPVIGIIALLIQSQIIKIQVHESDEPYDLAFNSIVQYKLKKSCISALVQKIKFLQTQKNVAILGFFDITPHEFIVYKGEDIQKKLFQFFMQFKLDYEYYRLLSQIQ
ncbi:unnamed protein product (macronuclear) [Paramecium tetraurelia]|uniref:Uncharacterized protein n=1 Tax=Paramecium tetraurelia TaxID=5888 RepID=A0BK63_PARTE|nr:uncharacterized protein GSPATT00029560001 [Paramecium tetraurelia]CAK58930.1 unnamed protein product [Paramecium tetraurelia]|eukprot:XP_001426328.1 hypothetical protein (macronuclear) [Paramecium tetraurelia strain d4-2]